MSCLDSTYDLVFYLGYHSGVGERYANMAHTYKE
ncbi:M55 family metallopeptidase [Finegoldia magna]